MIKISFFILVLFCLNLGSAQAEVYKFSMLPRYFPEKLTAMITPLSNHLGSATGHTIEPVLTDNFASYESAVLKGEIGIGYQNPLVYVNVSGTHEVIATAVKGKGGDKFRGIIISRPDSGITDIAGLKGKQVMIVSKASAGGYLSQKLTFKENGLDVDKECQLVEAADNKQENVIISVSIGDVDAGFIRESALHIADEFIMPGSIQKIKETAWLPNWAFSVNRNLPEKHKNVLREALLALKKESVELKALGLSGFKKASDGDYDVMRKLVGQ